MDSGGDRQKVEEHSQTDPQHPFYWAEAYKNGLREDENANYNIDHYNAFDNVHRYMGACLSEGEIKKVRFRLDMLSQFGIIRTSSS